MSTTPYFKEDPMSNKQDSSQMTIRERSHFNMFNTLRESASVNPCCFDNEMVLANALPSSHYDARIDAPKFGIELHSSTPIITFNHMTDGSMLSI